MAGGYGDVTTEFKSVYPMGTFDEAIELETPLTSSIKSTARYQMDGQGIPTFPLYLRGNWGGIGAIDDNADFPAVADPTRIQGTLTPVMFVRAIGLGIKAKYTGRSTKGAFEASLWDERVRKGVQYHAKHVEITFAGSNRGRLTVVESDGANTFVAKPAQGLVNVPEGLHIDVYDAFSGGAVRDSLSDREITLTDPATRTATYSGADQTAVAGDHVFVAGTYAQTPFSLDDIVEDGTVQGTLFTKSRTTYPQLKARVYSNGGVLRNVTEQLVLTSINEMRQRKGSKFTRLVSNWGQWQKLMEQIAADRRYPASKGTGSYTMGAMKNGFQILAPNTDLTLEAYDSVQPRKIYFLTDNWGMVETMPSDWFENGEQMLVPGSSTYKSAYVAFYGCIKNWFHVQPQEQAALVDLADPIVGDSVVEI